VGCSSLLCDLFPVDRSLMTLYGVNFIKVVRAAFMHSDPKSTKKTSLRCLFALLGSVHAKAARRTLMKLTHDVNGRKEMKLKVKFNFLLSLIRDKTLLY